MDDAARVATESPRSALATLATATRSPNADPALQVASKVDARISPATTRAIKGGESMVAAAAIFPEKETLNLGEEKSLKPPARIRSWIALYAWRAAPTTAADVGGSMAMPLSASL